MMIPCDVCGDMADVGQVEVVSYVQLHVGQIGTVEEEYICKDCANEKRYFESLTGLDADGNPGLY